MQDEFYATAFRKKIYNSIEELQKDVDQWLEFFNDQRPHSGKYCYGKTPHQTWIDSIPLAKAKQLNEQFQTADSAGNAPLEAAHAGGFPAGEDGAELHTIKTNPIPKFQ